MYGSEMARERVADRIREAEAERWSRSRAAARGAERRSRVRSGAAALMSGLVPARRRAVDPVA